MNRTAAPAVSFPRKLVGPRAPKRVWLDPPKAAPMPAPLPAWRSTMRIKATATAMCTMVSKMVISGPYSPAEAIGR